MNTLNDARPSPSSEAPDAAGVHRIWPGAGVPPGSENWSWQESTMQIPWSATPRRLSRNVVVPTVTVFRPDPATANGTAMIVAPGGAFHFLMIDYEGYDMARWLVERGITAFVLKYRVARTPDADADLLEFRNALQGRLSHPGPTETEPPPASHNAEIRAFGEADGRQAIRFVRQHAAEWNIDALVEVHDQAELDRALALGPGLIGINNRNLKTFITDIGTTLRLAPSVPRGVHVVAESGLSAPADLKRLAGVHVTSVLVGESLMRQKDVAAATHQLLGNGFR